VREVTEQRMNTQTAGLSLYATVDAAPAPALPAVDAVLPATSILYRWAKRVLDVGVSVVALALALPLFLVIATVVRLTSRGPALFRQSRIGRDGQEFNVLKFRSMCRDAEARLNDGGLYETYVATGYKLPVAEEFRVTKFGRFLRKTSLDELPQLLNVLGGSMSLVGPRPVVPSELASYGDLVQCYLGVRPGITGMWQVNGRSHVRFPERAHFDRDYFYGRSLRLDLAILARTPLAVLRGNGAY
jgi:lipopolysaccharide/colanic/teichoic acid biosynthesis glycosyltransferase